MQFNDRKKFRFQLNSIRAKMKDMKLKRFLHCFALELNMLTIRRKTKASDQRTEPMGKMEDLRIIIHKKRLMEKFTSIKLYAPKHCLSTDSDLKERDWEIVFLCPQLFHDSI